MSRVQLQLTTKATHHLESQGQVLCAGSNCSSQWKPLTNWRAKDSHHEQGPNAAHYRSHSLPGEPRTAIMSRFQMQANTEATHFLESQGQPTSAGSKYSSPPKPLTIWTAKDRCCQQGPNTAHQ